MGADRSLVCVWRNLMVANCEALQIWTIVLEYGFLGYSTLYTLSIHDRSADIYIFNIRISWQLVGISVAYGIIAIYTASSENTQKY